MLSTSSRIFTFIHLTCNAITINPTTRVLHLYSSTFRSMSQCLFYVVHYYYNYYHHYHHHNHHYIVDEQLNLTNRGRFSARAGIYLSQNSKCHWSKSSLLKMPEILIWSKANTPYIPGSLRDSMVWCVGTMTI